MQNLTECVQNSEDQNETLSETLSKHSAYYIKTVTVHTHLTDHFDSHFKLKNEVKIRILTLRVSTQIVCSIEDLLNVLCSEISFTNSALYLCFKCFLHLKQCWLSLSWSFKHLCIKYWWRISVRDRWQWQWWQSVFITLFSKWWWEWWCCRKQHWKWRHCCFYMLSSESCAEDVCSSL